MHRLWLSGALQISRCLAYWLLNALIKARWRLRQHFLGISGEVLQKCNWMHLQCSHQSVRGDWCITDYVFDIWWEVSERTANFSSLFLKSSGLFFNLMQSKSTAKTGEQKRVSDAVNVACKPSFPSQIPLGTWRRMHSDLPYLLRWFTFKKMQHVTAQKRRKYCV